MRWQRRAALAILQLSRSFLVVVRYSKPLQIALMLNTWLYCIVHECGISTRVLAFGNTVQTFRGWATSLFDRIIPVAFSWRLRLRLLFVLMLVWISLFTHKFPELAIRVFRLNRHFVVFITFISPSFVFHVRNLLSLWVKPTLLVSCQTHAVLEAYRWTSNDFIVLT